MVSGGFMRTLLGAYELCSPSTELMRVAFLKGGEQRSLDEETRRNMGCALGGEIGAWESSGGGRGTGHC